jgi:hypothetical protein
MKSADIEAEVSLLELQRDTLRNLLNLLIERFQNELPSVGELWIRRELESRIEDRPDTVAALGLEKLRSLKGKMNALVASLPDIAKKEMSNKVDWPHYRIRDRDSDSRGVSEFYFKQIFREVISHLGPVLDEFGLLTEPKDKLVSWHKIGEGRFRYAIDPKFDAGSTPVLEEFQRVYKDFRSVEDKLENKMKELAKTKARELWESA